MAGRKSKKQLYMEKEPNHFMKLRYREGDIQQAYPSMSIDEFSETKLNGLSKSIIAKLESNNYDPKNPPCTASTLRLYHDKCGCSFDYLMGETEYQSPTLKEIGKDPIFSQLDECFWDNLKSVLSNGYGTEAIMLNILFSNPTELQNILETIFQILLRMHDNTELLKGKNEMKESLEYTIAAHEFILNRPIDRYLTETILPLLDSEFYRYKHKTIPLLDKASEELMQKFLVFHSSQNETETAD